jgi:segregation and condensation protein B
MTKARKQAPKENASLSSPIPADDAPGSMLDVQAVPCPPIRAEDQAVVEDGVAETGEAVEGGEAVAMGRPTPPSAGQVVLENAGEMEEEPAVLVDSELATLLKTPLGLRAAIEALLFVSPEPLTARRIGNVLDLRDSRLVLATLKQLQAEYDDARRGLQVLETAEGFRMATRETFGDLILRLKGRRRRPALSPSAMETLAIVAYRQPIIRAEVEAIRGVESSGSLRNLIDLGLVEMVGRKDVLGRPPMYGVTDQFLQAFGLKSLQELPSIAELRRQCAENEKAAEQAEQEALAAQRGEESRQLLEASERLRAGRLAQDSQAPGEPDPASAQDAGAGEIAAPAAADEPDADEPDADEPDADEPPPPAAAAAEQAADP